MEETSDNEEYLLVPHKKRLVQQIISLGTHLSTSFHLLLLTTKKEISQERHICSHNL
ncbi:unnamed protein product, partial [Gulo gulo]